MGKYRHQRHRPAEKHREEIEEIEPRTTLFSQTYFTPASTVAQEVARAHPSGASADAEEHPGVEDRQAHRRR